MSRNEEWLQKCTEKHGSQRFDYTSSDFQGLTKPFTCRCICHNFDISLKQARLHLKSLNGGCVPCDTEMTRSTKTSKSKKKFLENAPIIHQGFYSYENVVFENMKTPVAIKCPNHGIFWQAPTKHVNKQGCPKCANERFADSQRKPECQFIEEANKVHDSKYAYSEYLATPNKVNIYCPDCDTIFSQNVTFHLQGQGCPPCARQKNARLRIDQARIRFFEKVKDSKDDFSDYKYISATTPSKIGCWKCNQSYYACPTSYLSNGSRCPHCTHKTELKIFEFLSEKYSVQRECKFQWCINPETNKFLRFDFCISTNILVECDGIQHFKDIAFFRRRRLDEIRWRDLFKQTCAIRNDFSVIRIYQEDVLYDKYDWKRDLLECIESILMNRTSQVYYLSSGDMYHGFDDSDSSVGNVPGKSDVKRICMSSKDVQQYYSENAFPTGV